MLEKGSVVKSVSGRDKDRLYVVTDFSHQFVLIADGKVRKISSPKKKSLKHLKLTNTVLDFSDITSDRKLRKLLSPLSGQFSPSEGGHLDV